MAHCGDKHEKTMHAVKTMILNLTFRMLPHTSSEVTVTLNNK